MYFTTLVCHLKIMLPHSSLSAPKYITPLYISPEHVTPPVFYHNLYNSFPQYVNLLICQPPTILPRSTISMSLTPSMSPSPLMSTFSILVPNYIILSVLYSPSIFYPYFYILNLPIYHSPFWVVVLPKYVTLSIIF